MLDYIIQSNIIQNLCYGAISPKQVENINAEIRKSLIANNETSFDLTTLHNQIMANTFFRLTSTQTQEAIVNGYVQTHLRPLLKESNVTHLSAQFYLYENLAFESAKALVNVLKDSDITSLNLRADKFLYHRVSDGYERYVTIPNTNTEDYQYGSNNMGPNDSSIKVIADTLKETHISNITLSEYKMSESDFGTLSESLKNSNVTHITFSMLDISDEGYNAFSAGIKDSPLMNITIEYLPYNYIFYGSRIISDKGMKYLSDGLIDSNVSAIAFKNCLISKNGYDIFSKVLKDTNITTIDLVGTYGLEESFSDSDFSNLIDSIKDTNVTTLNLSNNKITGIHQSNGCEMPTYLDLPLDSTNLTSLNLSSNSIGNQGIAGLAKSLKGSKVTDIDLSFNRFTDCGLKNFSMALKDTELTTINLSGNKISDDGLSFLVEGLKDSHVNTLRMHSGTFCNNSITEKGYNKLIEDLKHTPVKNLLIDEFSYDSYHEYIESQKTKTIPIDSVINSVNMGHKVIDINDVLLPNDSPISGNDHVIHAPLPMLSSTFIENNLPQIHDSGSVF